LVISIYGTWGGSTPPNAQHLLTNIYIMKKIIFMALILASIAGQAQFNHNAQFIKDEIPEIYSQIRTMAAIIYYGNWELMESEINDQANAFDMLARVMCHETYYEGLMEQCLEHYTYREPDGTVYAINYVAVVWEYQKKKKRHAKIVE